MRAKRRVPAPVPAQAREHRVPMSDGVRLATDVYLPARGSRWPVLLTRIPYDKAAPECRIPDLARWFTEHGYAVVAQDVRGKVRSEGELPPFRAEAADGYATIDWITGQSWCDGTVGMFGNSYYGFTQWAAASSGHPALRAIAPRVSSADLDAVLDRQGVFPLELAAVWALETWSDRELYEYTGALDWSVRPLSKLLPEALGFGNPLLEEWTHGGRTGAAYPVRGDIPALHLGGHFDFLQRGHLATWRAARSAGTAPQYLLLDAVDHGWTALREPDEPWSDPGIDGYLAPLLEFFDHHLRGLGEYPHPPVRWRLARSGEGLRTAGTWPPPESAPRSWFPDASGALSDRPGTGLEWVHDPADPVPSLVDPYVPLVEPPEESAVHERADVRSCTTEPFDAPLDLAGPVELRAEVSASGPSTHLMVTLTDVYPDGRAFRILDGAAQATAPWPARARVDLGETGYRMRAGHRLRVTLAGSAFPRYAPHPGNEQHFWTATETSTGTIRVTGAELRCQVL
ncbi:CocE/NonD family hydrolase [Sciscionella marina]|uniref:CocE/NonD family hydrolase n=1 Tax=Sciscionella marina TaxID=508770 RepID=UPI00036210A5|nr:CocE/NonD family hydrolase [Sciscionella marina]